ncbi:conserved hypothetical protein [Paracholeplasma brassicae]|uniref:Atrophied bacterial Ig domain-containing protein n=1 Tax=Acholeplasma brassicae TaxID=61635 RepID=U4KQ92_9MOLU|nr:immunoglobulin-like domain-containing protein [Paracholeplasma brassicae]CCV66712.1 conserved hypothetical protein [Paracholeplasma brassicae]
MKKALYFVFALALVLGLAACGEKTDPNQKAFDEAYQALNIVTNEDADKVITDFSVNTTLRGGAKAAWTSSDTNYAAVVASETGAIIKVTRPENGQGNKEIELTATVTLEKLSKTKKFSITILEMPLTETMTLSKLRDEKVAKDTDVTINDLVVVGLDQDAYYVSDGVTSMLVFGTPGPSIEVGLKGTVTAKVDVYFDAYQLKEVTWTNTTTGNEVVAVEGNLADFDMLSIDGNAEAITAQKLDNASYQVVSFSAKVVHRADFTGGANYQTTLVDPNSASNDAGFVLSYYKGLNHAALTLLDGIEITATAVIRELRDSRAVAPAIGDGSVPVYSLSILTFETRVLTDAEKVEFDEKNLSITTSFIEAGTVVLPSEGTFGSSIAWSFKNAEDVDNALVNLETGAVSMPTTGQVKTTVVATITSGAVEDTKEFTFVLGQPVLAKIDTAAAAATGDVVLVRGMVTSSEYYRTYFIQDETAGIAVYTSDAAMLATLKANVGKMVEVEGSKDLRSGLHQIAATRLVAVEGTVAVEAVVVTLGQTDLQDHVGSLVTLEDLTVTNVNTANYGNYEITLSDGTNTAMIKWDSRVTLSAEADADLKAMVKDAVVSITTPLAWSSSGAFLYFTDSTVVEFAVETDEMKVTADALALEVVSKVEASGNITLPVLGAKGSTISWASDNEAVISAAGVVVAPAEGTVTVKLTATIKLNEVTQTKEFNVVVGVSNVAASFDFGTSKQEGYVGTKNVVDSVSGNTIVFTTDGGQVTTSTFAPHDVMGAFLVLAPYKNTTDKTGTVTFSLGTVAATSVSFEASIWSPNDEDNVGTISVLQFQAKVGDEWVVVVDFLGEVENASYTSFSGDFDSASEFRFYGVGTSATCRVTIDNLVFGA